MRPVRHKHEFVTLEHLLFALLEDAPLARDTFQLRGRLDEIARALEEYFEDVLEKMPPTAQGDAGADVDVSVDDLVRGPAGRGQRAGSGRRRQHPRRALSGRAVVRCLSAAAAGRYAARHSQLHFARHLKGRSRASRCPTAVDEDEEFDGPGRQQRKKPLESFTVELVAAAAEGEIDPIVGRAAEIERTIQVLCRRKKNNPLYVGEPGVGKTALPKASRSRSAKATCRKF